MPPNTREEMSIPGNIFDRQHAWRDLEQLHNDWRNLATPSGIADDVKDSENRWNWEKWERRTIAERGECLNDKKVLCLWLTISRVFGLVLKIMTIPSSLLGDVSGKHSRTKQNFKAGSWISKLKFAQNRRISRSYCIGSRKSKQPARWRTSSIRNQLREKISLIRMIWIWLWRQNLDSSTILLTWSTKLPSVEPWQNKKGEKLLHRAEEWIIFSVEDKWVLFKQRRLQFSTHACHGRPWGHRGMKWRIVRNSHLEQGYSLVPKVKAQTDAKNL